MRIGVNCLAVDSSYVGGVNTYTLGLIEGMLESRGHDEIRIFAHSGNKSLFDAFARFDGCQIIEVPQANSFSRRVLRRLSRIPASKSFYAHFNNFVFREIVKRIESEVDVVYIPTTVLFPYNYSKPTVVSMHDIQQVHFPQFFTKDELLARKLSFGLTARHANYIQASTEFIREDLTKHFSEIDRSRVIVIPEGVKTEDFSKKSPVDVRSKYSLPQRFLFYPAQLWPHKNHLVILKALKILKDNGLTVSLILTGGKFSAADEIFSFLEVHELESVKYLGKVPFEDLRAIYQTASFLITAVLYESSSLPILEAAASGVPIIASRVGSNVEMAQNFKLNLFDAKDPEVLADLIRRLWNNTPELQDQIQSNLSAVSNFSWKNIGQKYLEFFKEIV